jgi:hypothetical protein
VNGKNKHKQKSRLSKRADHSLLRGTGFSKSALAIFCVIFASIGAYVIYSSYAAAPPGTNLTLTALDSTIRANWTAPTDPTVKWQVVSAWTGDGNTANGSKLVSSKVVGATSNVVDMNGLRSSDTYTIKLQSLDTGGNLSSPVTATVATDPQSPLKDAAFFDNFNDARDGSLDNNYYDVRAWSVYGDTAGLVETRKAFVSERHYHTSVIESIGQGGIMIRPRAPVNLTNPNGSARVATFEFEIDVPPVQAAHGKWFEVHLSKDIPPSHDAFGSGEVNDRMPNNIRFAIDRQTDKSQAYNVPNIQVNVDGVNRIFVGKRSLFTPSNVRVPVVIKVSPTYSAMIVNGVTEVETSSSYYVPTNGVTDSSFSLPFNVGHWSLMDVNYRSGYDGSVEAATPQGPTITNQLSHWDVLQWDGASGSYNPVVKTYMQPPIGGKICDGFATMFYHETPNCPPFMFDNDTYAKVNLNIPTSDDVTKIRSAKLLFNGPLRKGMTVKLNGNSLTTFAPRPNDEDQIQPLNIYDLTPTQINQLKNGDNAFEFSTPGLIDYVGVSQLELEVIYNQPRTINNPPQDFMPMFGVTGNNFRVDNLINQPDSVVTGSTFLYAMGSAVPHNYTIQQISPDADPWFTITTPKTGSLNPVVLGGQAIPISWSIDFSKFINPPEDADAGRPAVIKISGGTMDVYVAVLAVKDQNTVAPNYMNIVSNSSIFNKAGIPDYHLVSSPPSNIGADINTDGIVNLTDLSFLLSSFGQSTTQCITNIAYKCDLSNPADNIVNIFDLSILLSKYGT